MELDPSLFFPFYFFGCMGPAIGRFEESVGFLQRAVELEPTLSYPMWALACLHMQMGHYDEAFWAFERTAAVDCAAGEAAHWPGYDGFHGECLRRVGRLDEARERCLAALEDVEKSDHMYRDTNRVVCLVTLGRTALDQGDLAAARAAYGQAIAHVQGRQHTLAGGTLVVQALAGLARANSDPAAYADALDLYERQDPFDFSLYLGVRRRHHAFRPLGRRCGAGVGRRIPRAPRQGGTKRLGPGAARLVMNRRSPRVVPASRP